MAISTEIITPDDAEATERTFYENRLARMKTAATHWLDADIADLARQVFDAEDASRGWLDAEGWIEWLIDEASGDELIYWETHPEARFYAELSRDVDLEGFLSSRADRFAEVMAESVLDEIQLDDEYENIIRLLTPPLTKMLAGLGSGIGWADPRGELIYITADELLKTANA